MGGKFGFQSVDSKFSDLVVVEGHIGGQLIYIEPLCQFGIVTGFDFF